MCQTNSSVFLKLLKLNVILCFSSLLLIHTGWAGENKGPAILVNPDPKHRTIPELSCQWTQLGVVNNDKLTYRTAEVNMRLRLRDQFLYLKGSDAEDERMIGIITRIERRRWQSDHHFIILDEVLEKGTFLTMENNETKIRPITCKPIDTSLR